MVIGLTRGDDVVKVEPSNTIAVSERRAALEAKAQKYTARAIGAYRAAAEAQAAFDTVGEHLAKGVGNQYASKAQAALVALAAL